MAVHTVNDPDELTLGDGHVVCSTFVPDDDGDYELPSSIGGEPERCRAVYYAVPADATPEQLREIAFEIRHGMPMEDYQRWVIHEAMKVQAGA